MFAGEATGKRLKRDGCDTLLMPDNQGLRAHQRQRRHNS
ncbi:hypothetical protein ACWGI9_41840 [Streptomyces sp. NPDC054833]